MRALVSYGHSDATETDKHNGQKKDRVPTKKVSKEIGEYVDYEEVKKKKS